IASRSHLELVCPVIEEALDEAGVEVAALDGIAVTVTPGLVGCLLVGLSAAKGLCLASGKPLVPVNHVHAHVFGALMPWLAERRAAGEPAEPPWPLASLVVSGGHTSLYRSRGPAEHERLGRTLDDAAGEAYDKVSAILGLSYPGGPVLDRLAQRGDARAFDFPRHRSPGGGESSGAGAGPLDVSFSGLKTAVLYAVRASPEPSPARGVALRPGVRPADVAASFQAAVVDVLADRLQRCAETIGAGGLVICGGVAANSALRARARELAASLGLPLFLPPMALATDNAVMIAGLGHWLLEAGRVGDLSQDVVARTD
ncbi:MAG TPA: tRNA (adenosine(37)-N6)-threonylcarbamoyltransferase complex transferase subunit TsaD, partial [Planctomycetota bacterium]|nr:tRNA (adenosine(37)-N6)-threonylcarbamoyltransferase complex transferase subunit TsaD [Planctomycetota bacterium]